MRFTDAHSGGSTCVPSRYALLTGQLYNLREDLAEQHNRYLEYPERVERLRSKLKKESAK